MPILSQLTFYPIKSCAGISLSSATLTGAGLMHEHVYDREWMLVDDDNNFLTQREHPRMALITPRLRSETLELRAPGMLRLDLTLDLPDPDTASRRTVKLWQHTLDAYDGDSVTRQWFSQFLGVSCQLVRFHPEAHHPVNPARTGGKDIGTLFSDGYPLLLIGQASLDDLNRRLAAQGRAALPMDRFRPNLVIAGAEAHDEDHAAHLAIGNAEIRPVKPCPRCPIPSIDQQTGMPGPDPLDVLRTYRAGVGGIGGIGFGMNCIVTRGEGETLRIGQEVALELAFQG
ncbi:MOSC domain-containing protein [Noviherbaspirillum suwonense]|nr:MOSC N-terminal beta barrel domain-containing protein [Noviherbaspirillum suwonense]